MPGAQAALEEIGKVFIGETYTGAGHAFMRSGEEPNATPANKSAMEKSWERLLAVLERM